MWFCISNPAFNQIQWIVSLLISNVISILCDNFPGKKNTENSVPVHLGLQFYSLPLPTPHPKSRLPPGDWHLSLLWLQISRRRPKEGLGRGRRFRTGLGLLCRVLLGNADHHRLCGRRPRISLPRSDLLFEGFMGTPPYDSPVWDLWLCPSWIQQDLGSSSPVSTAGHAVSWTSDPKTSLLVSTPGNSPSSFPFLQLSSLWEARAFLGLGWSFELAELVQPPLS